MINIEARLAEFLSIPSHLATLFGSKSRYDIGNIVIYKSNISNILSRGDQVTKTNYIK